MSMRVAWLLIFCSFLGCRGPTRVTASDITSSAPSHESAGPPADVEPRSVNVAALHGERLPEANIGVSLGEHSCYVTLAGAVKCWGDNTVGELGDGTNVPSPYPVRAGTMSDAASVAVARGVTCVVTTSGGVRCWGGERKPYNIARSKALLGPSDVKDLSDVTQLALTVHGGTCALHRDGHVSCLRRTDNPGEPPYGVSVIVPGLDAVDLAAGSDRFCALTRSSELACWEHHDDESGVDGARIMPITTLRGAESRTQLAASDDRFCAIVENGSVECWGNYATKMLPNPTWPRLPFVRVPDVAGAARLALGSELSCAQTTGGSIRCWGDHMAPQSAPPRALSPVFVLAGLAPGAKLLSGADRTGVCLEATDRTILCLNASLDHAPRSLPLSRIERKTLADVPPLSAADVAVPPGRVAGSPECTGARPLWRCHYEWDGKALKPASPAARPPTGATIYGGLRQNEVIEIPSGSRTLLISSADYMVRRQLVVREVIEGEAFVRGQLRPAEPDPDQPDGNVYLMASYDHAFWMDGGVIHFVLSKRLSNPP